ncbi:peptidase C48, SUMO/sentrin/Ubl1, partial [Tanacetum coccineum]
MRQAAEKEAAEKEAAKKEAAAKEKEEAEKIAAAKKKEQVEKLAATKKKEKAKKLAAAKKKEQAKKLAATKKKEEDEKLAAANKEQAEKLATTKKKEEAEKLAATKNEQAEKLASTKKKEEAEKKAAAEKEAASKKKEEAEKKAAAEKEKAKKEVASKKKEEAEKKAAAKKEKAEKEANTKKEAAEKNDAGTAKTGTEESEATTVSNTFESPKVQQKIFGKGQESADKSSNDEPKNKGKRITKPSIYLKSPFMNKMVKTQKKSDKDEILCARSIFCMQRDISEVVFDDGKGTIANRKEIQSLATGITIQKQIIDTFVTVLNYEERIRSGGKDKRRHYFPTNVVTTHLLNKEKDKAKKYVSFENMINNQINTSESKKEMKDVSYAFFPIVVEGQYYVIVFNLLKANAEILDNEKDCDYNKYQEVFDSVKALFLKYLKKHQHPCVDKLTKEKPAKESQQQNGRLALLRKTTDYLTQMTNMRMRYTTKILMHEMNTKRGLMSEYANKFGEDNKEEEKVKKMVEDAIRKRIAEGA